MTRVVIAAALFAIPLWSGLYGAREGDVIEQTIIAPDGTVVVERETV